MVETANSCRCLKECQDDQTRTRDLGRDRATNLDNSLKSGVASSCSAGQMYAQYSFTNPSQAGHPMNQTYGSDFLDQVPLIEPINPIANAAESGAPLGVRDSLFTML
jgi:hypothetical protein